MKKNKLMIFLLSLILLIPTFTSSADQDDWIYVRDKDPCATSKKGSRSDVGGEGGINADYLTPGSEKNKVMLEIYDSLTEDHGFSGAAAIGVLANVVHESNFVVDVAEGHSGYNYPYYGSDAVESAGSGSPLRFGMNNRAPIRGMGYYIRDGESFLGGGGLFQFTPYTKFANSQFWKQTGDGWSTPNQVNCLIDEVESSRGFVLYYDIGVASRMKAAGFTMYPDFKAFMGGSDLKLAANSFFSWYERGAGTPDRGIEAQKIAATGQVDPDKPADPSKWPDLSGGKGAGVQSSAAAKNRKKCTKGKQASSEFGLRTVDIALTRVGGRYVFGGNTWGTSYKDVATDCSGFVGFVLRRAGMKFKGEELPRTAKDIGMTMQSWGWAIKKEELVAGDVIVFSEIGPLAVADHIALYGGENEQYPNGFIIHASSPVRGIRVDDFSYDRISQAYYFRPQNDSHAELGEPDLSDVGPIPTFEEAVARVVGD